MTVDLRRPGGAADRVPGDRPLEFREGRGLLLDEASVPALQRLVESCEDDLRLATGGAAPAEVARAVLREPSPGVPPRLAIGVAGPRGELAAALVARGDFPGPGCWQVEFLLVAPGMRGRGIATGLLARVERIVAARGGSTIQAVIPTRDLAALQLFRRAGFDARDPVVLPFGDREQRVNVVVRSLRAAVMDAHG